MFLALIAFAVASATANTLQKRLLPCRGLCMKCNTFSHGKNQSPDHCNHLSFAIAQL